jgi:hypothetical protein
MKKPNGKCLCGARQWWTLDNGKCWVCGVCHPDPSPELHPQPVEEDIEKVKLDTLRKRIAVGNEKLITAFNIIRKIKDTNEFDRQYEVWSESCKKLDELARESRSLGYTGCFFSGEPYEKEKATRCNSWPEGMTCIVCGDSNIFWDVVIEEKKQPDIKHSVLSDESIKFLQMLGSEI